MLYEAYGEHAPSISACEFWYRRFKSGDFDNSDKERDGRPTKFEDTELEKLMDQDCSQTQKELAESLSVTQQAISVRLKAMGMIQKMGTWVPYDLKPGDIERRLTPHVAKPVKNYLENVGWEILTHPPYSPDIAPSDYYLFRSMQNALSGIRFTSVEGIRIWVDTYIASKDDKIFWNGIHSLPERWGKDVASEGKYF